MNEFEANIQAVLRVQHTFGMEMINEWNGWNFGKNEHG